jgi:hypothetical protein
MKLFAISFFSLGFACLSTQASALVLTGANPAAPPLTQLAAGKKKSVIDKSCLMICEKWGEHDCEKWVMKCKGDTGYPKGLTLRQ